MESMWLDLHARSSDKNEMYSMESDDNHNMTKYFARLIWLHIKTI